MEGEKRCVAQNTITVVMGITTIVIHFISMQDFIIMNTIVAITRSLEEALVMYK
jgi:hypothetical protein